MRHIGFDHGRHIGQKELSFQLGKFPFHANVEIGKLRDGRAVNYVEFEAVKAFYRQSLRPGAAEIFHARIKRAEDVDIVGNYLVAVESVSDEEHLFLHKLAAAGMQFVFELRGGVNDGDGMMSFCEISNAHARMRGTYPRLPGDVSHVGGDVRVRTQNAVQKRAHVPDLVYLEDGQKRAQRAFQF